MIQRVIRDSSHIDHGEDVRCHCGQLVARWVDDSIEIKCKRCRRLVRIAAPRTRASSSAKS